MNVIFTEEFETPIFVTQLLEGTISGTFHYYLRWFPSKFNRNINCSNIFF